MKKTVLRLALATAAVSWVAACDSGDDSSFNDPNASSGASGTPYGSSGFGGSSSGESSSGIGTSSGSAGSSGLAACATSSQKVETLPIDMSLLVDTSGSMDYKAARTDLTSKWVNVKNALKSFASNAAYDDMGVAMEFFPKELTCDVTGYGTPDLPFATLPNAATAMFAALNRQGMSGGTPTTQALRGMVQYTRTRAMTTQGRKAVVVVATDGVPDASCAGNNVADAIEEARLAFTGTPSVPVYVIGIGQTGGDVSVMNRIAAAGGSTQAELVNAGTDIESSFLEALNKIRRTALSCDYPLPQGTVNLDQVNVQFTDSGTATTFLYASTAERCALAPDHAWTLDNPTSPTKVVLCPATCDRVKASTAGQIDVVFGCPRLETK